MKITNVISIVLGLVILALSSMATIVIAQDMAMQSREVIEAFVEPMKLYDLPPGIAPEKLPEPDSSGAKFMQEYCSQCHDIFTPRMHSAEKWTIVSQRMSFHMQMMPSGVKNGKIIQIKAPSLEEGATLLSYLKRNSLIAADQNKLKGLDTPGGMKFLKTCSQCHVLPEPNQYTPQEWPGVIARMQQNMQFMKKPLIQPEEEKQILEYLVPPARD